jgi:hypothetical protein
MPAVVNFGRGHRFAAYPRCSADVVRVSVTTNMLPRKRVLLGVAVALAGLAVLACGLLGAWMARIPDPPTRSVRLPSGAVVEFLDYGVPPEAPPTWHLDYRTRIPIRERRQLAAEVVALWADVKGQAEHAGYSRVFIMPTNFSRRVVFDGWRPVVFSHESTAFCLQRQEGAWKRTGGWPQEYRDE